MGHDLFHFADEVDGMDWKKVWQALTGEAIRIQSISVKTSPDAPVDFVELFNAGNFSACSQDLGLITEMNVDPEKDMRVETYRMQARHEIGVQDPMIVISAPPCTVFFSYAKFGIDLTSIRHRFPDLTLFRCRIDVESMLNLCQIDP